MPKLKTITIPTDYQTWLADLRKHLDRNRGAQAELARHLAELRGLKPAGCQVKLSKILNQGFNPSADFFFDMATWLASQE